MVDDYYPEQDGGERLSSEKVNCALSASMWVPKERVSNRKALLNAAMVETQNARTGEVGHISLATELEDHIVLPKYFHDDWLDYLGFEYETYEHQGDRYVFTDNIKVRDEAQAKAWEAFRKAKSGVLNLACGKGKTVMALKKIALEGYRAIVIVNNTGLLRQWRDSAQKFLGLSYDEIGILQGTSAAKEEEWNKPLVIGMIQTLANRANSLTFDQRASFGTVIFDEVHHLSARKFSLTAPLFLGNRYGLTATPVREDGLEVVYYSHIGKIFYSDLKGELTAKIYFKKMPTSLALGDKIMDRTGQFSPGKLYTCLAGKTRRNMKIVNLVRRALDKGRRILVLTHSKDHPAVLAELFDTRYGDRKGIKAGVVTGSTPGESRTRIIEESRVTFATFQVAKEGLDAPSLDTIIFATPFKAWGAFQQGKGRVERKKSNKRDPLVVVLEDYNIGPASGMCRSLKKNILAHGFKYHST